jgi:CheY-like chemotaxis protein
MAKTPFPRPLRVLLVDDYPDSAEGLRRLLVLHGHDVRTALDGPSALAMANVFRPDAVFLDIILPGLDGFQVARRLRQIPALSEALLVGVSGYGQIKDPHHPDVAAFDHYLLKPVEIEAVVRLLATRARGRPAPESPAGEGRFDRTLAGEGGVPAAVRLLLGRTILVVEDDEATREWLMLFLRREGCAVIAVGDSEEALAYLRAALAPNLIVLDMLTPRMDGWVFLEERRREPALARIPVLITTALGVASPEWAAALGATGCLRKPADLEALLSEIHRLCV